MPVIGTINARPGDTYIKNMNVSDSDVGFLWIENIVVQKTCIHIYLYTEVHFPEEGESIEDFLKDNPELIIIKRTGPGLTEDDFELDFTKLAETYNDFVLEAPSGIMDILVEEKNNYITFTKVTVVTDYSHKKKEGLLDTLEDLENKLEVAKQNEDYELATKLLVKIEEKKKQ